jgi:hypothetical protein
MTITVKEETEMDAGQPFAVTGSGRGSASLYPSIEQQLYLNYSKPSYDIPEGAKIYGKITFASSASKETEYELPIIINFK